MLFRSELANAEGEETVRTESSSNAHEHGCTAATVVSLLPNDTEACSHDSSDGVHLHLSLGDDPLRLEDGRSESDGVCRNARLLVHA